MFLTTGAFSKYRESMDDWIEVSEKGGGKRLKKRSDSHIKGGGEGREPDADVEKREKLKEEAALTDIPDWLESNEREGRAVSDTVTRTKLPAGRVSDAMPIRSVDKKPRQNPPNPYKGLASSHETIPEPERFKSSGGRDKGKPWTGRP